MSWKCPQCGVEGLDDAQGSHGIDDGGCGYVRVPSGVILSSEDTGKSLTLRLATTLGQPVLRELAPDDAKFVSIEQFRVEPAPAHGSWQLATISWATNPTFVNDAPVPAEGVVLKSGDCVSVRHKMRLRVTLLQ